MQDNAPLIFLIFLILLSLLFGVMAYNRFGDLEGTDPEDQQGNGSTRMDAQIERTREELEEIKDGIHKEEREVEAQRKQLRLERARFELYSRQSRDYTSAQMERVLSVKAAKGFRSQATELGSRVSEEKDKTKTKVRHDENEIREKADTLVKELTEAREKAVDRTREEKKRHEREKGTFRVQQNYEKSGVDEFKRQLNALTQREVERAAVQVEVDGHVVLSDPVHNTIVIDVGSADGVRNGYRFECFAIRPGNRKVHKAYLEVRKAKPNVSECMIVQKLVHLPKDPLSRYVASQPEEKYSPYQDSGKKGFGLQPLSAHPKAVRMGMSPLNPIVEGDYVQNPFYRPGKTYTFYIAGDKSFDKFSVQKSAIAYTWPHIERVVKFYGSKVSKKVNLGVDYIIAQKNPNDDPEFAKAVALGIPVIYEWELFRFLDQK